MLKFTVVSREMTRGGESVFVMHRAGCKDIAKERGYPSGDFEAETWQAAQKHAHAEMNSDFIAEGSQGWPIEIKPCCKR